MRNVPHRDCEMGSQRLYRTRLQGVLLERTTYLHVRIYPSLAAKVTSVKPYVLDF